MRKALKSAVVYMTILALCVVISPAGAFAAEANSTIGGTIVGVDGRSALGYTVHLIDETGTVIQQVTTDESGAYTFVDVPVGSYGVGIETPDGMMAPVAAPPIRVGAGDAVLRDIKLVEADAQTANQVATSNPAVGGWWGGLSGIAKAGVIVGLGAVTYGVVEAFDDDDDEIPASDTNPATGS
jgi:hypothetical protein